MQGVRGKLVRHQNLGMMSDELTGPKSESRTEQVVEQFIAIFIRVKAVIDVRLQSQVHMMVIKFSIEDKKDLVVIDKGCNGLCFQPFGSCIKIFGKAIPARFICECYLGKVIVQNCLVEMDDKLPVVYQLHSRKGKDATHTFDDVEDLGQSSLLGKLGHFVDVNVWIFKHICRGICWHRERDVHIVDIIVEIGLGGPESYSLSRHFKSKLRLTIVHTLLDIVAPQPLYCPRIN